MSNEIQAVKSVGSLDKPPRRILLEKQLSYAIQRAQRDYQHVNDKKTEKSEPVVQYLGSKIDIRV